MTLTYVLWNRSEKSSNKEIPKKRSQGGAVIVVVDNCCMLYLIIIISNFPPDPTELKRVDSRYHQRDKMII